MNSIETLYKRLMRLSSRQETNPNGIIQSRELADLLIAVEAVKLAHWMGIEYSGRFEAILRESLVLRHPYTYFAQTVRRKK